jgi:hypothetical protein
LSSRTENSVGVAARADDGGDDRYCCREHSFALLWCVKFRFSFPIIKKNERTRGRKEEKFPHKLCDLCINRTDTRKQTRGRIFIKGKYESNVRARRVVARARLRLAHVEIF